MEIEPVFYLVTVVLYFYLDLQIVMVFQQYFSYLVSFKLSTFVTVVICSPKCNNQKR
jgi:hypothetical protein